MLSSRRTIVVVLAMTACRHAAPQPEEHAPPQPEAVHWSHADLGRHCGPTASVDLEVSRSCELTIHELDRAPHRATLPAGDCNALFGQAADVRPQPSGSCPPVAQFIEKLEIRMVGGQMMYGCWDSLTRSMAQLAERYAPQWHTPAASGHGCGFESDTIEAK